MMERVRAAQWAKGLDFGCKLVPSLTEKERRTVRVSFPKSEHPVRRGHPPCFSYRPSSFPSFFLLLTTLEFSTALLRC